MYKRYYSPFEEDVIIEDDAEIITPQKLEAEDKSFEETQQTDFTKSNECRGESTNLFGALGNDDIILLGILLLLLNEQKDNRDVPMILGIGFLLLINYIT